MDKSFIITIVIVFSSIACATAQTPSAQEKPMPVQNTASTHNSQNSLDWEGTYQGIVPCADCEGIQTQITLNKNLTYIYKIKYLEKNDTVFEKKGGFVWDDKERKITLADIDKEKQPTQYMVEENSLIQLDRKGKKITGSLADKYVLKKRQNQLTETYWRLIELGGKAIKRNKNNPKEAHFVLKSEDNTLSGSGGCNSFTGVFEANKGKRIIFSNIAATKMACKNMSNESNFFKVLEIADNYTIKGNTLLLNKAKIVTLAKFEAVYFK